MRTVRFTYDPRSAYKCSEPNDQSGEYVRADVAAELLAMLERLVTEARRFGEDDGEMYPDKLLDMIYGDVPGVIAKASPGHTGAGPVG